MSFWNVEGFTTDGSAQNSNIEDFSIIPGGTKAIAMAREVKKVTSEHTGETYFEGKLKIVSEDFKNQVVKVKFRVFEDDAKKRARAINQFMRLFILCGVELPQGEPTAEDLAQLNNNPFGIEIDIWESTNSETGEPMSGNWVRAYQPADGFECVVGKKMPKDEPQTGAQRPATQGGAGGTSQPAGTTAQNFDNDIPW